MSGELILVAGGYGVVGSRIAADLAPDHPERLVVAGRSAEQADATAVAISHGAHGRSLDVTVPSSIAKALDGVGHVVNCVDEPRRALLHAAIDRGLRYTDITPHLVELGRREGYERVDAAARRSGAVVVLGAGSYPASRT